MKLFLTLFSISLTLCAHAQSYIDFQQKRIDALDGSKNNSIDIIDADIRRSATYTYIFLIDELQTEIKENTFIQAELKAHLFKQIESELKEVDEDKLLAVIREEQRYTFLLEFLKIYGTQDLSNYLNLNKDKVFTIINFMSPFPEMFSFLSNLSSNYIDQILYQYNDFQEFDYSKKLLEYLIAKAPVVSKKYFSSNHPVYREMLNSSNNAIQTIVKINNRYRRNTKAYVLLDKIMNSEITIEQADQLGDSEAYFKSLLEIRAKVNPFAEISLDRELNYVALEYVREVNHLHEESHNTRFRIINDLNAAELYTLIVYGENEIFTSSFNGVYKQLRDKMTQEKLSGFDVLANVGFNKFRIFIKMLSYYGTLNSFLNTMDKEEKQYVLELFIGDIQNSNDRIVQAVSVADAISAIDDLSILRIFETEILRIMTKKHLDDDARLIYNLLITMFKPKVQIYYPFFDSISKLYVIPPIESISSSDLFGIDGKNVQKHFFYDDKDGQASYNSFLNTFSNKKHWSIKEEKEFIKIVSSNNLVKIYANKPKYDETAWYYVDRELKANNEEVEFIIHRGHSYYVDYTIEKIPQTTKLILLGSCGGYNKLSLLLERSDNAQIISTKQIGSMSVNNPLIYKMAEKIRTQNELNWKEYWSELKTHFNKTSKQTQTRFYDYVPPHQNLGAKFISAYKMLSKAESI